MKYITAQRNYFSIACLALLILSCAKKTEVNIDSEKNLMFRGSPEHAGVSSKASFGNVIQKWKFETLGAVRGSVSILGDRIYVGSSDTYLYCLNKNTGDIFWKFKTSGAINSTPALDHNAVYFTSRDNALYSLNATTGALNWKFETGELLPHKWGWDYFISSPTVNFGAIYFGSGDGNVYSVAAIDGKLNWKFATKGRIRCTPAVKDNVVYVGSFDANMYALDKETGELKWKFETDGLRFNSDSSGWDRNSIDSSPAIMDSVLAFGSRDGNVYAINSQTGKLYWKFSYGPTWSISSPAIHNNTVFIGWSDNYLFSAIDLKTGKERWRYQCRYYVYSSPVASDSIVYVGSHDRSLYGLHTRTGEKVWQVRLNAGILSSPVIDDNILYIGSDDGAVYAFEKSTKPVIHKAVFSLNGVPGYWNTDPRLAPYLMSYGYDLMDSIKLEKFLTKHINDKQPSVVVFTTERIPPTLLGGTNSPGLLREYLEAGGKVVWTGNIPNVHRFDSRGNVIGENSAVAEKLLDVHFDITHDWGSYNISSTAEGKKWGLPNWWIGTFSVKPQADLQVLAVNEYNRPSVWVKNYGGKEGAGFVMYRGWETSRSARDHELEMVRRLAEYGLN
jgi:eukaryotic-like serine/threonine-protein kinase